MKSRKTMDLSERFNKRWLGYAAAAGAAGVGLLASAQPARADIIYTPANISLDGGATLDLNNDGVGDFVFSWRVRTFSFVYFGSEQFLDVRGAQAGNGILSFGSPLNKGVVIGPHGAFSPYVGTLAGEIGSQFSSRAPIRTTLLGPWANVDGKYLGLEFLIGRQIHFGWAQLDVNIDHLGYPPYPFLDATLTGYAYDTVANQSLTAGQGQTPEPGTLGLLALGSLGLGFWRRRKAVGSQQ